MNIDINNTMYAFWRVHLDRLYTDRGNFERLNRQHKGKYQKKLENVQKEIEKYSEKSRKEYRKVMGIKTFLDIELFDLFKSQSIKPEILKISMGLSTKYFFKANTDKYFLGWCSYD